MMKDMLKCIDCGRIFHISEAKTVCEDRGEYWGVPCHETMTACPCCESTYLEEYDDNADEDEE